MGYASVLGDSSYLHGLLAYNGVLWLIASLQRMVFTGSYYGLAAALMAVPRMAWANWVNFLANLRAYRQVRAIGDARRVAWDKTTHVFPSVAQRSGRATLRPDPDRPGGNHAAILERALERSGRRRIGRALLEGR